MKILIVMHSIHENNPVLGFFTGWVKELAKKFEKVTVICLEKGECNLPSNVTVYSLGKERFENSNIENSLKIKNSKLKIFRRINYMFRFYYLIWKLRRNYDSIFIHMNQEYVILGWKFWKLWGKKIYLWRNHPHGNFFTNISVWVSDKVFCTSKFAFVAKYRKTVLMPVGIDTDKFRVTSHESRVTNSILFLGRMDRIKRPDLLIEALNILDKKGIDFICDFYGEPTPDTGGYYESLKRGVEKSELKSKINFYKAVANHETPKIYNEHDIYVNLTPTGSFDKTILEAAACGCVLVMANKSLKGELDQNMIIENDTPQAVAECIELWLNNGHEDLKVASKMLREYVIKNHSLDILIERLSREICKK